MEAFEELKRMFVSGRITRRHFLRSCAALGVAGAGLALVQPLGLRRAEAQKVLSGKYGAIPMMPNLPQYVGIEKGFFEKNGVKIVHQVMQDLITTYDAHAGGSTDAGFSDNVTFVRSAAKGFDLRACLYGSHALMKEPDYVNILVPPNSTIKTAKDLEGKRLANLEDNGIDALLIREWMQRKGADPDKVTVKQMWFGNMLAAADKGDVDAFVGVEPFSIEAVAKGYRILSNYGLELRPGLLWSFPWAKEERIKKNPELYRRWKKGTDAAIDYINTKPADIPAIVEKYTGIPKAVAAKVTVPLYKKRIDPVEVQWFADLAFKHKFVDKKVDASKLVLYP